MIKIECTAHSLSVSVSQMQMETVIQSMIIVKEEMHISTLAFFFFCGLFFGIFN